MPVVINGDTGITQSGEFDSDSSFGFKNRIINGGMAIDQRNAGASATPLNAQYTLDRWQFQLSQNSKFTVQQNAGSLSGTNLPAGFKNYLGITSTAATSIGAGDYFAFLQYIEGFNTADLDWGTSRAQTVTLSFWVRSSLTGTFGGSLFNSAFNRSYPFTYTISSANTWEQKSITIAGDTSGTWVGATNGIGMGVCFGFGVGSTYSGTAGSWAGAGLFSATGATSVVATNGATFYITGVQLEKGSTATSFDFRSYGTELYLCQRYFQQLMGNGAEMNAWSMWNLDSTSAASYIFFPVVMRASPTCTVVGTPQNISGGVVAADKWSIYSSSWKGCNYISLNTQSRTGVRFDANPVNTITSGGACGLYGGNQCNLTFSAEL